MDIIKERNQNALDMQRRVNELEDKVAKLREFGKKNVELEIKLKESDRTIINLDTKISLLNRKIDIEKEKDSKTIEVYKSLEAFQDELIESSEGAFDYNFLICRKLVMKLSFDLDLIKITIDAALTVATEVIVQPMSPAPAMEALPLEPEVPLQPQPKAPVTTEVQASETPTVEVISVVSSCR